MSEEAASRLRTLAHDYAEGRLSLETYRRLRAPLLDGVSGAVDDSASVITQPRAMRPDAAERPDGAAASFAGRRSRDSAGASQRRGQLIGIAGAILIAIALTLAWHGLRRAPSPAPQAQVASAAGGPQSAEAIHALLQPLIDDPDWSDTRLLALNDALRRAGATSIAAAQSADWFNAVVDQVRSRVKERQALAGARLNPNSSPLAALAVTLGVDLVAPDRPLRIEVRTEADVRNRRAQPH